MSIRNLVIPIIVVFILFAVFGLYAPFMGGMDHDTGCPFMPGGTALCGMPLAHLQHWQSAFAATLIYLLTLCAAALFFIVRLDRLSIGDPQCVRYRLRGRIADRPTLFQELFSRGILNPKIF